MIPFSTLSEKADFLWRVGAVYMLAVILFFLNIIMLPIPFIGAMEIPFILMVVYYWTIYRPTLIPPAFVFAAGLLFDLLTAGLLGLGAMVFTLMRFAVFSQRNFLLSQPFIVVWFGFCLIAAAASIITWIINAFAHWAFISPFALVPEYCAGVIFYPFIAYILHLGHKLLPAPQMPLTRQSQQRKIY